ncbi:type II toxin-antitoxin system PemK/MazF family toxin [Thiotrichales bacterium 19S9-12]|nr:type II toxin-antitoxin system PemK/MazF family toxin [Thiotrichales bacterium 19S9-11]MCF6811184.1 type II toxin-antitoxin system PemK/MazF family toxin [Thiotrichales bacterium 19S9-12]
MAITFHPRPGQILLCDFSQGFKEPEMVKNKRPVIVITGSIQGRSHLVTVVPLSTKKPTEIQPYHYEIPKRSMPMIGRFQNSSSWVKGDMLYTVGFHRLNLIRLGKKNAQGKRAYFQQRLSRDQMKIVLQCVLNGLNLNQLTQHL